MIFGEMALQFRKADLVPVVARDMRVLKLVACKRAVEVGNPFEGYVESSVDKVAGKIDWNAQPLFKHAWSDGKLVGCTHTLSDHNAIPPPHVIIFAERIF